MTALRRAVRARLGSGNDAAAAENGKPPSIAIGDKQAAVGGFYFGRDHMLIHRHLEAITIGSDQTGQWNLTIDLELPDDPAAQCEFHNGVAHFLFPLMFLKKSEGRTAFGARGEDGRSFPLLNRVACDRISAVAIAQAANRVLAERGLKELPRKSIEFILQSVSGGKPYAAGVILNELFEKLDPAVVEAWKEVGLTENLEMLVEHSIVWVPLSGLPGERRSITVGHDVELLRRPLIRANLRELKSTDWPRLRRRKARKYNDANRHLDTGEAKYGRRGINRISFSVLGERISQPLAWMPIEFDFPTIHTRRCRSYHFELICPRGLSPRGVKLATDQKQDNLEGRTTLGTRAAQLYLPGGRAVGDLMFRATVGVGTGAFPTLWFLMGTITAAMLWVLAGTDPATALIEQESHSKNEIAAGILLVVPALLGAIVIGAEDDPVTNLLAGSRILLLIAGLCSVGAATVLIGAEPLGESPRASWTVCATIATAVTVPLATSWLLSLRMVWRRLKYLHNTRRQYVALFGLAIVAMSLVLILNGVGEKEHVLRGGLAIALLLTAVPLILLASDRLAVAIDAHRGYVSVGAMLIAMTCVALGCVELRAAIDYLAKFHETAETWALWIIPIATLLVGPLLTIGTWPFRQMPREVHIAPAVCRTVIAGERIRELHKLRSKEAKVKRFGDWKKLWDLMAPPSGETERGVVAEKAGNTEANWSSGLRSTVSLPPYVGADFPHYAEPPPDAELDDDNRRVREELKAHMERLLGADVHSGPVRLQ